MIFEIIISLFIGLISLFIFLLVRTLSLSTTHNKECIIEKSEPIDINIDEAIKRLGMALTFPTVSYESGQVVGPEFKAFINYLEKTFPLVHSCPWIERRVINGGSLLFICQARDASRARPWMIIAHTDVVPVPPNEIADWSADPFGGHVLADETGRSYLYGRGSLDAKHIVMASLEALEHLLARPGRRRLAQASLLLCFGHDEETGGIHGARMVAQELSLQFEHLPKMAEAEKKGIINRPLSFIIDEGTNVYIKIPIVQSPDQERRLAVISVTEKSCLRLKLSVETAPGHASMPPKNCAITLLARAVRRLHAHKFEAQLGKVTFLDEAVARILPYVSSFPARFLLVNRHILSPLIVRLVDDSTLFRVVREKFDSELPHPFDFVRRTLQGGIKDNVVPSRADAVFNQRIFPSQSFEEIMELNRKVVDDDSVKMEKIMCGDQVPIADHKSPAYAAISKSIMQTFGTGTIVIPGILPASTDSQHFLKMADDVYRFSPLLLHLSDNKRIHGINERIDVATYASCIHFYHQLMENVSGFCGDARD